MTRAVFLVKKGSLCGFRLSDHCDADDAGYDIVCAAVSSAAYMTANTITDILGCPAAIETQDAYLELVVEKADIERCAAILAGFRLHMTELQKQYPQYIQVEITEV